MKGQLKETFKKWWVLVVVATLALSLTSCGKKRYLMSGSGVSCMAADSYSMGDFLIATYPSGQGQYQLKVTVLGLTDPGDKISIVLFDTSTRYFDVLKNNSAPRVGQDFIFTITESQLQNYDEVRIQDEFYGAWDQATPSKYSDCYFPLPGETGDY